MTMSVDNYHFPSIDSTNIWAKVNVHHFHRKRITVVTADTQTAGRGRQERKWHSPAGVNLYASYCFFVPQTRKDIANVPQVVAVAIAQQLEQYGLTPQLKWPNDILIDGKKVGGLLCETTPVNDLIGIVIGLGLNVNVSVDALAKLDNKATSMAVEAGHSFDLNKVTDDVQDGVTKALEAYLKNGFKPFLPLFRKFLMHHLGDAMRFHVGQRLLEGSFYNLNDDGTLNLILDDRIQTFNSGEFV